MSLEKLSNTQSGSAKRLLCLEVNPPRGVSLESIYERLNGQTDGIDFFNVTDSALAKMRLSALPFGAILKHRYGIEPLVNISCRDRNVIGLQGDLLAGWVSGIRSVIALTGDAVSVGDSPDSKGVFEVNSIGLLKVISALNSGKDIVGNPLSGAPDFFPGVVVNPNVKNINAEIRRLERKKEAGARYALSQPVFDEEQSVTFFAQARRVDIPIFMGLLPFKSAHAALAVASLVPGIRISDNIQSVISAQGDDLGDFFIEHCVKLAKLNREHVRGFHVISGATPKLALKLMHRLREIS